MRGLFIFSGPSFPSPGLGAVNPPVREPMDEADGLVPGGSGVSHPVHASRLGLEPPGGSEGRLNYDWQCL